MPPLRDRKEDIPLLVRGFLRHFCKENDKPLLDLTTDAMDALLSLQLARQRSRAAHRHRARRRHGDRPKNHLARSSDGSCGKQPATASPGGISAANAFEEKSSPLDLHETEKKLIMQALATTNGNVTAAAKKLGISRRTLHRKINEMNLAKAPTEGCESVAGVDDTGKPLITNHAPPAAAADSSLIISFSAAESAGEGRRTGPR
mgnify:CR=1 FL=1